MHVTERVSPGYTRKSPSEGPNQQFAGRFFSPRPSVFDTVSLTPRYALRLAHKEVWHKYYLARFVQS